MQTVHDQAQGPETVIGGRGVEIECQENAGDQDPEVGVQGWHPDQGQGPHSIRLLKLT